MSTNKDHLITEKALDNLLGQAFLNLDFTNTKNMELMETIAAHHLVQTPSLLITLKKIMLNKFLIGTIAVALLITLGITVFQDTADIQATPSVNQQTPSGQMFTPTTGSVPDNLSPQSEMNTTPIVLQDKETSTDQDEEIIPESDEQQSEHTYSRSYTAPENVIKKQDSAYIFPVLTEAEEKAHYKQKNKMITALIKFNKDKYAYIPSGSCEYKRQTVSVQAFYAQTTEVSNLEYRTFLSDLILQNRKQEFLAALPDESQWTKKMPYAYNEPMSNQYFSHPAYNEYPVVNVSRKGAEMYCKWLTTEVNKILKENDKPLMMDLRIPDEYEWAYAALNGKSRLKYASGNAYLRNSKGCYEMNYICHSLEECNYDSTLQLYLPVTDKHGYYEDGGFYPVKTTSYLPNSYGLYCMAGNVSEMIIMHDTKKPATKGGSWFSCDHFLEIEAEDEHHGETGASPFIGFRPVITFLATEE